MPSKYVGNMVIAMQAIAATLDHYRNDEVTLLVDANFAELMALCFGSRCRLMFYPRRAVGTSGIVSRIRRFLAFVSELRATKFEQLVDFDGTVVSARVTRLARSSEKIGPGFAKRPEVYTRTIPIDRDSQHCLDDFRAMANAVGAVLASDQYFTIPPAPAAAWTNANADLPVLDHGPPIVCIHPSATKDYKQWDIGRFAQLADRLLAKGWRVVLVGAGDAERDRIDTMLGMMTGSPIDLHGRLSLVQLVCLFQHAALFIGNDSGPMHLAAASGTRVIALFGPTELLRWRPRSARTFIIKGREACSPACRPEACLHDYRCLKSLEVEQVEQFVPDPENR